MKYNDIAIIGISGRYPKASTLYEFHSNLKKGKDCIGKIPEERLKLLNLDASKEYVEIGYLEGIQHFDHEFFGISSIEADMISPEQRISLEAAAEAILNAGYSLRSFEGSNCGVFFAADDSEYSKLIKRTSSTSDLGSIKSMLPGKIGFYLDLQGPNVIYDSGCSSSSVAIHDSCIKLMVGEIDYGLVGGVLLELKGVEAIKKEYDMLGLGSSSYRSYPFDEKADGIGIGEGCCCVLLKRLDDAERDGDHIYGVIKCGTVNGDGKRCSNVTMPSVQGQRDVMLNTWKDITVAELTEIEAHGIGTAIGDTIEVDSITQAIDGREINEGRILLSSVKSNIGHLSPVAGLSGLIKICIGFRYNESYPIANFEKPNHLIDFEKTSLEPLKNIHIWEKGKKRVAGLNSFGLSGTNSHLIIENYVKETVKKTVKQRMLIKLSAKTEASFSAYKNELVKCLQSEFTPEDMQKIAFTLNKGRDDFAVRRLIAANDWGDMLEKIDMLSPAASGTKYKVVFVLKTSACNEVEISNLYDIAPGVQDKYEKVVGNEDINYKYAMYGYCRDMGIKPDLLLADVQGRSIADFLSGKCSRDKLMEGLSQPINDNYENLIAQIKKQAEESNLIILDFTVNSRLKDELIDEDIKVFNLLNPKDFEKLLITYYNNGCDINWSAYYGRNVEKKVPLPGYCFEKITHWAEMKPVNMAPGINENGAAAEKKGKKALAKDNAEAAEENNNKYLEAENILEDIWKQILDFDSDIGHDEDFFELGGNSLLIQQMSVKINEKFQTQFDIYEIYENSSISLLTGKIVDSINDK